MSRHIFWPTRDSLTVDSFGTPCAGIPVRVYATQRGGNAITDLVYVDSAGNPNGAVPSGILTSDGDGLIPSFAGPDGGPTTVWGNHGIGGTRVALTADPVGSGGGGSTGPHAGTHAAGGSDPVLLDQAQVSGLGAALAGKAALTHAAAHASGGADPVTVTQGQVTGLTTALGAKADLVAGVLPSAQLPAIAITAVRVVNSQAEMLALSASQGWAAIRTDNATTYLLATSSPTTLADWKVILAPGQVLSVAGKTGVVALAASDVTSGTLDVARLPLGTTSGTVTVGNDSRFTTLTNAVTAVQSQADATDTAVTALTVRVTAVENAGGVPGPGTTPPAAPTAVTAAAGILQAGITFTPPTDTGGSAITSYRVTASTGQTATGPASPILVTGLPAGVPVTFTVTATNNAGTSAASAPSSPVTPLAPPANTTAPAYVHSLGSAALTTSGNSVTVTTTAQAIAGNSLVVAIACNGDPGAVTVTDASANVYRLDGVAANGTATTLMVFSSLLANALPSGSPIRVGFGSPRTLATVQAHEVTGLTDKTVDDNAVGTANSATDLTTAALTTDVGNDFVFAAWGMAGNNSPATFTQGSGFTTALASLAGTGGSSRDMYTEYLVKTTAGTVNPAATVSTAKNYAGLSVAYSAGFGGTVGGGAATGTYSDLASLNAAIPTATPGDVITLAAGTFAGKLVVTGIHGTAAEPILITGPSTAVFNAGNQASGYGVHLDDCTWVIVHGFKVMNAQKGVIVDRCTNCTIEYLEVASMGQEGIHLRNETTYCTVQYNNIHDTGLSNPNFGEGMYCGTAVSNWGAATRLPAAMSGFPDHSDFNQFLNNTITNCTAECMDIKEGTFGGVLSGNSFNGSQIAGANSADSWVDVKGESWTVSGNTGNTIMTDGYQTHGISIPGTYTAPYTDGLGVAHPGVKSGNNNVFDANVSHCSPATGYGFNMATATNGNKVYTNNIIDGAAAGRSNITETVKAATAWLSGVGESYTTVAAWTGFRGEATTYARVWADSDTDNMLNLYAMQPFYDAGWDGVLDLAVGGPSDWATAATGAFDATWRAQCQKALSLWGNLKQLHLSMAHEFNNGYAWEVSAGEQANFKTAWSRWYGIVQEELVAHGKNAKVVLSCNSDTNSGWTVTSGMPNLAHIDLVGVDFYDFYPQLPDDAAWSTNYTAYKGDVPRGIGAWFSFAQSIGKPLSLPEWGVAPNTFDPNRPYFVQKMYETFAAHVPADPYQPGPGKLAGEAYFNAYAGHGKIYPTSTGNPDVATMYTGLVWGSTT